MSKHMKGSVGSHDASSEDRDGENGNTKRGKRG